MQPGKKIRENSLLAQYCIQRAHDSGLLQRNLPLVSQPYLLQVHKNSGGSGLQVKTVLDIGNESEHGAEITRLVCFETEPKVVEPEWDEPR